MHPARRVPFALKQKLKAELNRMVSLGVIEKVDKPTDWVNSIVIVEKSNGDIRLCLDPKDLNRAVKREFSQMPTAEEIMSRMSGATVFSKLDASAGYWQVKVDDASSDLLAFNTPFGRFKFKRLPFGVHCAYLELNIVINTFSGRTFLVESDHKPLQPILKRNIDKAPPRIQRMLLRLQKYDFELVFTPGTTIPVADTLSRAFSPSSAPSEPSVFDYQVHMIFSYLPITEEKFKEMQSSTANDSTLQHLQRVVLNGWPEDKNLLPIEVMPYYQYRSELSVVNGLVFKGDRVVIPSSMRKETTS